MSAADPRTLARYRRAHESGELASLVPRSAFKAMAAVAGVVQSGQLDLARAMLEGHRNGEDNPAFSAMANLLRGLSADDLTTPRFRDRAEDDFQLVETDGASTVIFVFTGQAHRVGAPLDLFDRWLARLGTHVVYLRDFRRLFYLAGVRSIDGGLAGLSARLRRIATDLSAKRIVTLGSSAGTYAALRLGQELGADAMLSLGGPTTLERLHDEIARRARIEGLDAAELIASATPLAPGDAQHWPPTRLAFAGDNEVDLWQAERLQQVPAVTLHPVHDWPHHSTVGPLARSGALAEHLDWLAGRGEGEPTAPPTAAGPTIVDGFAPIELASRQGRKILARSDSPTLRSLQANFVRQAEPGLCGIASALTILRARGLAPPFAEARNTDEIREFLGRFGADSLLELARKRGVAISELRDLLERAAVRAEMVLAADTDPRSFRQRAVDHVTRADHFVIVNYDRRRLGQPGRGHFSPLAAYDPKSDRFLVYDVIPDRTPAVWVKTKTLFSAMKGRSPGSPNPSRGMIVIAP